MSPFRRKAVENSLIAVLRDRPGADWTLKTIREPVGEPIDGCSPAELAAAVQALRYAGKLTWDGLALSPSMLREGMGQASAPVPPSEPAGEDPALVAEGGAAPAPSSGPDDDDDYPGEVNDELAGGATSASPSDGPVADGPNPPQPASRRGDNGPPHGASFVPKALLHKAGIHAAATRAAARPLPMPAHEPEVARQVREEVEEIRARRRAALSTATVSQPLELRKFGVPDMSFGEGVQSLLAENPNDLMAAISRKHVALWRRIVLLSRTRAERPAQALYAALEAGLEQLEDPEQPAALADVA